MKNRLIMCGIMICLLAIFAGAALAEDLIDFTLAVEPGSLAAPGDVQVTVRLTNMADTDMQEPLSLYDPAGKPVTAFYDGGSVLIKAGATANWQGMWKVTQAQLDAGEIAYSVKYNLIEADGSVKQIQKEAKAKIAFTGERALLQVTRTIDPEVVRTGKTVSVVYELVNAGTVPLESITVRESSSISSSTKKVASLAVGASEKVTFTTTMKSADLKSAANINYKAKGGKETLKVSVPEETIACAKPGLKFSLVSDKTAVNIGDTVLLTLKLTNSGNISYSGISVTDAKLGEVFTGVDVPAGQTVEKTKELIMQEKSTFKFTLNLPDNTGTTNVETTNEVVVSAYDPSQVLRITLNVTTENMTVAQIPADVRFAIVVTNASDVTAKDVKIQHGSTVIYNIATLAPAQSVTLTRDFTISEAGKYRFSAHTLDTLENPVVFDANEVMITYAAPTQTPTLIPSITVKPLVLKDMPTEESLNPVLTKGRDTLLIVALAIGAVFAVCFVLFIISSVARARAKKASAGAYDHLELGTRRDYNEKPAGADRARFADEDTVEKVSTEDADLVVERPSAKYLRDDADEMEAPKDDAGTGDVTGAYRLTREEPQENAEAQEQPAAEQPTRRAAKKARKNEEEE